MSNLFTRIAAFFLSIAAAFGGLFGSLRGEIPAGKSAAELAAMETVFRHPETADKIYAVEVGNIAGGELDTVICLQGLVNRRSPSIYIIYDSTYRSYLDEMKSAGKTVVTADPEGNAWTLSSLVEQFRPYITDGGFTLYDESEFAEGLNTAFNLATAEGWLAFRSDKRELAESLGLTLKKQITEKDCTYDAQKKLLDEYADAFAKNAVVHVKLAVRGLRDFAVQQGFFICYSESNAAGKRFLKSVLSVMNKNCIVLGWGETEKHFVAFLSKLGCSVIPSDHSRNNSLLACFGTEKAEQKRSGAPLPTDPSKHYAAIVFSDGDNSQWVQGGFREFYQKLSSGSDFPMTWTYPPLQQELCSVSNKRIYSAATENNCFISGISGAAYMNPSMYKKDCLGDYADITAAAMLKSDMRVVAILDDKPSVFKKADFERRFDYFSRYETVSGGIVMLDPGRYAAGEGRVWFTNGKPFVSVRLSLWYPEGEGSTVPAEWIEEQANTVNSFAADIHSINGYSVINVHPWTVSIENLNLFVSLLDDDVELVTAETLINMISANVEPVSSEVTG